jgi:ATP diphosphatase
LIKASAGYITISLIFFFKQIMNQIQSECEEIQEHLRAGISKSNQAELQDEIGDLLHVVFSLCVFCRLSPQVTLGQTLTKFERRLRAVKLIAEENGLNTLEGQPFDELMCIWDKAKKLVG